ncbi:MAG TPA: hypothetical protein VE994_23135 [Terriglobales bacterium]|nr:hypothetical protein [Terriglobales bacterium]
MATRGHDQMTEDKRIRCRMAACREAPVDGKDWNFYLINDGDAPLDSAVLCRVSTEWGDFEHTQATDTCITDLAPGAHALMWRDDGEFRITFSLRIRAGRREARLEFEFPKLYIQRKLQPVNGLPGKLGWEQAAEG